MLSSCLAIYLHPPQSLWNGVRLCDQTCEWVQWLGWECFEHLLLIVSWWTEGNEYLLNWAHVLWMYRECTVSVLRAYCECNVSVPWVYYKCTVSVLRVYCECTVSVLRVHWQCTWVYCECTANVQSVLQVHCECILIVLWVYREFTVSVL
jgi:hypothetical protein